jgi:hypothetical protein
LKENIKNIESGLEIIKQLRPVGYDWKHKKEHNSDFGLIAQEVEKIIPEIVTEKMVLFTRTEDLYKTVSYEKLIPFLIKSIQELTEEIEKLK